GCPYYLRSPHALDYHPLCFESLENLCCVWSDGGSIVVTHSKAFVSWSLFFPISVLLRVILYGGQFNLV
ncbi:hypothetical protein EV424DRAFT_1558954, partial [Suillus variegatus]